MSSPDLIDFISREKWITVTVMGSIFTFSMVNKFKEFIFDPLMVQLLPPKSFEFMKVHLHDDWPSPNVNIPNTSIENKGSYTLNFGIFIRETIIWIFMISLLYILSIVFKFPDIKNGSSGAAIM